MFDPSLYESPMALQPSAILDAVRLAAGTAFKFLYLQELEVRYFEDNYITHDTLGITRGADAGRSVIWLKAGMTVNDTIETFLHEAKHAEQQHDILASDDRLPCSIGAISEKEAETFMQSQAPTVRAKLREVERKGRLPWATTAVLPD